MASNEVSSGSIFVLLFWSFLVRINKLLEDGWVISQMNTQTVDVDPKLENYLHKETLVSFVILEKPDEK